MRPYTEKLYWTLLLVLLASILIMGIGKSKNKSDFQDYYTASQKIYQRQDIYNLTLLKELKQTMTWKDVFKPEGIRKLNLLKGNIGTYIYPPFFAFSLIPLTSLFSYPTASILFMCFNFLCLLGSLYICIKLLDLKSFLPILPVGILLNFRFLESHVNNNQIAFVLIFLILLAIYLDKPLISGFLLALATVIKLTPAIFILYFLMRKKYLTICFFLIGVTFWLFLPSILGFEYHFKMLTNWYELVLQSAMKNPVFRAWKNNQSLMATIAKYFLAGADPINQSNFSMPFFVIGEKLARGLSFLMSSSLVLYLMFQDYRKKNDPLMISGLFILSVVLSGISWIHSFSVLLFPTFYMLQIVHNQKNVPYKKWQPTIGYAILVLLTARQVSGKYLENLTLMYSIFLYTSIFLFFYLSILSQPERRNHATQ